MLDWIPASSEIFDGETWVPGPDGPEDNIYDHCMIQV